LFDRRFQLVRIARLIFQCLGVKLPEKMPYDRGSVVGYGVQGVREAQMIEYGAKP
jgi:hypothetical protein